MGRKRSRARPGYAIDSGLGGVMVWELGQDVAGDQSLLKAITDVVDQAMRK
jgi:GH18 family chitinase